MEICPVHPHNLIPKYLKSWAKYLKHNLGLTVALIQIPANNCVELVARRSSAQDTDRRKKPENSQTFTVQFNDVRIVCTTESLGFFVEFGGSAVRILHHTISNIDSGNNWHTVYTYIFVLWPKIQISSFLIKCSGNVDKITDNSKYNIENCINLYF